MLPCMICEEDHYKKYFPHRDAVAKFFKGTSKPIQQQHLIAKNLACSQGGNAGHSHHGDASSRTSEVYMFTTINETTQ
jgi:hypothetical protein